MVIEHKSNQYSPFIKWKMFALIRIKRSYGSPQVLASVSWIYQTMYNLALISTLRLSLYSCYSSA